MLTARIDEISLKGKPLQPASPGLVNGQNGLSAQHSEAAEGEEENEVPSFAADKLDASCSPEEFVLHSAQPLLDGYEASASTELDENGHGSLYASEPVIQSDDKHAQAPEARTISSRKLGSEEPAPHHMDAPAALAVGEGEYRAGKSNEEADGFYICPPNQ